MVKLIPPRTTLLPLPDASTTDILSELHMGAERRERELRSSELSQSVPHASTRPGIPDAIGLAGLRAAFVLFDHWRLNDAQAAILLGGVATRTLARWRRSLPARLETDLKTRLSFLMGIHQALRTLFTESQRVHGWVRRENADFEGRTPLDVMLDGQITDLMRVRQYLDAQRT
jgi:uncharacterized protein (DUF2384 family)